MQRKPISCWHRSMQLLVCAVLLSQQGCFQHRERYNLASFWMDYNTLCAPAIFFEKQSHFPYQAKQVSYLHWQYGVTPGRNVKYSRPDLTGGNLGAEAAMYEGVMNVNGINGSLQPVMEPMPAVNMQPMMNSKPTVNANGAMRVAPPQVKLKPGVEMKKPLMEMIPPPPAPPTP
ncbi:hypothetical protein [uncultured Gimesia sp.]|jgi:hypothetical protein|uniref:hypothetical protein n=1 Tax=uncultured Gimesia sp. TaxID=1678688 RepID=UPI002634A37E|nr:hypothetical protein [uncultured Gimesia sp.]